MRHSFVSSQSRTRRRARSSPVPRTPPRRGQPQGEEKGGPLQRMDASSISISVTSGVRRCADEDSPAQAPKMAGHVKEKRLKPTPPNCPHSKPSRAFSARVTPELPRKAEVPQTRRPSRVHPQAIPEQDREQPGRDDVGGGRDRSQFGGEIQRGELVDVPADHDVGRVADERRGAARTIATAITWVSTRGTGNTPEPRSATVRATGTTRRK